MPDLPKRQSLSSQAAEIMQKMIEAGEMTDQLPGERTLATRLQIGRDTLRAALDLMEKRGYISKKAHGKRREILHKKRAVSGKKKTKRVAFISPKTLKELPPLMLLEVDTLRELLNQQGCQLEVLSPAVFQLKNPARPLGKIVSESRFDAWILYQCPASVQNWFQKEKLPAIIRGYPHDQVSLPCLGEDWEAAAYHAGVTLVRKGHHRIGLLMPDSKLAGLIATETGLRRAVENPETGGKVHTIIDHQDPDSVINALSRAFQLETPPSAIVTTRSRHVLTLMTWLASHRLRVPHELSLIALSYEPWFEYIQPRISHYHSDPEALARTLARRVQSLLEDNTGGATRKLVTPEFNEGNSVQTV